jgi:hypothetical protein
LAAYYYYVSASLPMLIGPEQEVPITMEVMMDTCQRFLSKGDYEVLNSSTMIPQGTVAPGICEVFLEWEKSLRNELALLRAAEQNLNPEDHLRMSESILGTSVIAAEAMTKDSPLEAELYLDGCRWSRIADLSVGHFFDIEFLQSYKMKLQILERRSLFDEESGFAAYRDLYARVLTASGTEIPTGSENL